MILDRSKFTVTKLIIRIPNRNNENNNTNNNNNNKIRVIIIVITKKYINVGYIASLYNNETW